MEDKRIQVMTILQDYFCRDTPLDVAADSILRLFSVVCCALCNTELEDYEIAACRQMGATDPEMICETCWNRIQNEGYENVMP